MPSSTLDRCSLQRNMRSKKITRLSSFGHSRNSHASAGVMARHDGPFITTPNIQRTSSKRYRRIVGRTFATAHADDAGRPGGSFADKWRAGNGCLNRFGLTIAPQRSRKALTFPRKDPVDADQRSFSKRKGLARDARLSGTTLRREP